MPAIIKIAAVVSILAVVSLLPYALFCLVLILDGPSHDEVARVVSPDGVLDAVLVESNGGATTSFGYAIFIVPHGKKAKGSQVAFLYAAVRNSRAYGANLKWDSSTRLAVEYLDAKDEGLEQPVASVSGRKVTVLLRPGVTDPSAPPGGMLYNLEKGLQTQNAGKRQ